jgi:SAM-dependent methyltransferase
MEMSQTHWDSVYATEHLDELGWYEPMPSTLGLVTAYSTPVDSVIDVGGGTSPLTIQLARLGYRDLTVLDISERALEASQTALREHVEVVSWIRADVTRYRPDRRWKLWHDRAVFHFLIGQDDREAYRSVAASAVKPGGILIVATFAPEGPERCAGLEVRRYDVAALAEEFAPDFELIEGRRLIPITAAGDQRPYVGVALRRSTSHPIVRSPRHANLLRPPHPPFKGTR